MNWTELPNPKKAAIKQAKNSRKMSQKNYVCRGFGTFFRFFRHFRTFSDILGSDQIGKKKPKKNPKTKLPGVRNIFLHAQYDWTTGVPDNGNEWRKFRVVPRSHPLRPLVFYCVFVGVETEGLLDYQGRAGIISIVRWNLSGHIRCRFSIFFCRATAVLSRGNKREVL